MIPWIRNNMCLKRPKLLLAVRQCEQLTLIPGGSSTRATASSPSRVARIPGRAVENCEAQMSREDWANEVLNEEESAKSTCQSTGVLSVYPVYFVILIQRSRSGGARRKAQTFQPKSAWFSAVLEQVICIVAGLLIRNSVRGSPSGCTVQHKFFYRSAVPSENVSGIHFDNKYPREGPRPDREDLPGELDQMYMQGGTFIRNAIWNC